MPKWIVVLFGRHVCTSYSSEKVTLGIWRFVGRSYEFRGEYYEYITGKLERK